MCAMNEMSEAVPGETKIIMDPIHDLLHFQKEGPMPRRQYGCKERTESRGNKEEWVQGEETRLHTNAI